MNVASIVSLVALVVTALASAFSGNLQSFWASHPDVAAALAAIWGAAAHFLPSPTTPPSEK